MDAKTLFNRAVEQAGVCVRHVHDDQLSNPTPCSEWDLKTLLNHIVYELAWVPDLLAGKTVAEVGGAHDGNLLGDDPHAAWEKAKTAALEAVAAVDLNATVHLSYGDVSAEHYIREIASDMAVHGWDVGQSEQCNIIIESDVAQTIYDFMQPRSAELRASGLFGSEVPTQPTDSIQTKLLGLMGRKAYQYTDEPDQDSR